MARDCKAVIVHPAYPLLAQQGVYSRMLPMDALHKIADSLDTAKDICNFEAVCHACRDVAQDQRLWRKLYSTRFMMPSCDVGDWKALYKFQETIFYKILLAHAAQSLGKIRMGPQPIRLAVYA